MREQPSNPGNENRCEVGSAAIERARSTRTFGRLWLAGSLLWLGLVAAVLIIALDRLYHRGSWGNISDDPFGMAIMYFLMQLAFVAVVLAIGIYIDNAMAGQISTGDLPDECRRRSNTTQHVLLSCIPTIAGVALLFTNLMGDKRDPWSSWQEQHYWGWPIISATASDFLDCASSFETSGSFSIYWIMVDAIVGATIVYCVVRSVKYMNKRWKTGMRYTLKEIIVFVTAAAVTMSFIGIERYTHLSGVYYSAGEPTYRPIHLLPVAVEIPVLIGVACTIMVIATAFFELCGLIVTRLCRIDRDEE
jgi:hypothetical protein